MAARPTLPPFSSIPMRVYFTVWRTVARHSVKNATACPTDPRKFQFSGSHANIRPESSLPARPSSGPDRRATRTKEKGRMSIRTLVASIVGTAIGLVALRNANDRWAKMMFTAALVSAGVAALGACFLQAKERARWTGEAIFSGGYLILALTPWISSSLGTTHLFDYIHAKVVASTVAHFEMSRFDQDTSSFRIVSSDGAIHDRKVPNGVVRSAPAERLLASIEPANRWRSALPGAANRKQFQRVGHSLFSLLAGPLGGTVGIWFYARARAGRG